MLTQGDIAVILSSSAPCASGERHALDLLSPQGVILIENVLWSGEVLKQPPLDERTAAIQELNRAVANDPNVTAVLVVRRKT